jgi:broad specificity phosphatase PhoE
MSRNKQPKTELVLIRHGQSDWNIARRCQGTLDESRLTPDGLAQARELARGLSRSSIAAIYSSSQVRSVQTAEAIAEALNLSVQIEPRLAEMHQGVWQGMVYPDIEKQYGDLYRQFMTNPLAVTPPGGETIQALARRASLAVDDIAERHPGQHVLVVSHEIPLAALRCLAARQSLSALWEYGPANGEIVRLEWPIDRPGWRETLWQWLDFRWWFAGSE